MTRRIRSALGPVLVGMLLALSSSAASADAPHILSASGTGQEHFEEMATAAEQAALFILPSVSPDEFTQRALTVNATTASHMLDTRGTGQEHFEAMSVQDASFVIAAPATTN